MPSKKETTAAAPKAVVKKPVFAWCIYGGPLKTGHTIVKVTEKHPEAELEELKSFFGNGIRGRWAKSKDGQIETIKGALSDKIGAKKIDGSDILYTINATETFTIIKEICGAKTATKMGERKEKDAKKDDEEDSGSEDEAESDSEDEKPKKETKAKTNAKETVKETAKESTKKGKKEEEVKETTKSKTKESAKESTKESAKESAKNKKTKKDEESEPDSEAEDEKKATKGKGKTTAKADKTEKSDKTEPKKGKTSKVVVDDTDSSDSDSDEAVDE